MLMFFVCFVVAALIGEEDGGDGDAAQELGVISRCVAIINNTLIGVTYIVRYWQ